MQDLPLRKVFLIALIVSLSVAALLAIGALILPRRPDWSMLSSVLVFAGFSIVAQMLAAVMERRRLLPLVYAGFGFDGLALLLWLVVIWFEGPMSWKATQVTIQAAGMSSIIAIVLAQSGMLALPRFAKREGRIVRWTTVGFAGATGGLVVLLIGWGDAITRVIDDDLLLRMLGVMSIITVAGTVITPVLWRMESGPAAASTRESIPSRVNIDLTCPRCHEMQTLPAGPQLCTACGLRITIDVEEPRCPCGYLLHTLTSDRCPECGRPIRAQDRWAA